MFRSVCMTVPHGILCFLPSYRILNQLFEYMESNMILNQIQMKKIIVREPKRSSDLSTVMELYEEAIRLPKKYGAQVDGALMFAVFRGKVSEGIDFTDDLARVVISVGIPFPNLMDDLVNEKKRYNDDNCKTLNILSGDQWYVTQAYRALNQALGRCLRHKNDWGALVLVDERLIQQKAGNTGVSSARLSKWIRNQLLVYPKYHEFEVALSHFVRNMKNELKSEILHNENITIDS